MVPPPNSALPRPRTLLPSASFAPPHPPIVNAENCRKALEKVGNPNILINLVSRRVRQLNSPGTALSRPLVSVGPNVGMADVALLEIIEDKITFELPEAPEPLKAPVKKRRRAAH
jgi:DNA-directed RNA polymerase subunit omega